MRLSQVAAFQSHSRTLHCTPRRAIASASRAAISKWTICGAGLKPGTKTTLGNVGTGGSNGRNPDGPVDEDSAGGIAAEHDQRGSRGGSPEDQRGAQDQRERREHG